MMKKALRSAFGPALGIMTGYLLALNSTGLGLHLFSCGVLFEIWKAKSMDYSARSC